MRRRLIRAAILLPTLLLLLGFFLVISQQDRISRESWERISIGMQQSEVDQILGGPGLSNEQAEMQIEKLANEIGKPPYTYEKTFLQEMEAFGDLELRWLGRRGMIVVHFDREGKVTGKFFQGWRSVNETILDHLRDVFHSDN